MNAKKDFQSLMDLLEYRVKVQPNSIAYRFLKDNKDEEPDTITYAELADAVRRIAFHLRENHVKPGDRVLINHLPNIRYIVSFFACMYAGTIAVPIYPPRFNSRLDRITSILRDSGAKVSLTSTLVTNSMDIIDEEEFKNLIWIETDLLESSAERLDDSKLPNTQRQDMAFLQYTSGSTSAPKGVMLSHGNILANLECIREKFEIIPFEVDPGRDEGVIWLPPYHDMGLIGGILTPLYSGFPVTLMSPFLFLQRPIRWLETITRYKGTISGGPNFAFDQLTRRIREDRLAELDLSSWRIAFCGAEPIHTEMIRRFVDKFSVCGFRKSMFYLCYGLAESTLISTGIDASKEPMVFKADKEKLAAENYAQKLEEGLETQSKLILSCGSPAQEHELKIINLNTMDVCADGEIGEVWLSGPSIADGYWNLPEKTEENFRARYKSQSNDTYYLRTGDLGFVSDGELYITGRFKDMLIIRGKNYYPQDIELTVQESHDKIQSGGASFSVEHQREEKLIVVCEVHRRVSDEDIDEILDAIELKVLEDHGLSVHTISLVKPYSIPLTSSGKVMRSFSKAQFLEGKLEEVASKKAS